MPIAFSVKFTTWQLVATPKVLAPADWTTFAEALVDDLEAAAFGTKDETLFFDQLPDVPGVSISVRDVGGLPANIPAPQTQILFTIRGESWEDARKFAAKVYNHVHGRTDWSLPGYRVLAAQCVALPASLGEDQNERCRVGFNAMFRYHATDQGASTVGFGGKRDPNEEG